MHKAINIVLPLFVTLLLVFVLTANVGAQAQEDCRPLTGNDYLECVENGGIPNPGREDCRDLPPGNDYIECVENGGIPNPPPPTTDPDEGGSGDRATSDLEGEFVEEFNRQITVNAGGDTSENPIFVRLNQIIAFLSIGVGIVITGSVVFAGIQWSASRGNPQATGQAVSRLWSAGIALALYIFMTVILSWLIPGGWIA